MKSSMAPIALRRSESPALARRIDARVAFRKLADRHLDAAYRLAGAILHDAVEAEDATRDAFLRAWQKWSTLRDDSRFEAWFDRILVNVCRGDRYRLIPESAA